MRILYIAKHGSGDNDDEGAITHAFRELGHEVITLGEHRGRRAINYKTPAPDLLLFHKWDDTTTLRELRGRYPIAFWYFDLVTYPDPSLTSRNRQRVSWMNRITPLVDIGFCTDGDWVNQDTSGKLVRLLQGADERFVGAGNYHSDFKMVNVLFPGHAKGGQGRLNHVRHLEQKYGAGFSNCNGLHQRRLADRVAMTRFVVAPQHPATDHYWSNRVYLISGFGGCLLHPYCETLTQHYEDRKSILLYHSVEECDELIAEYSGSLSSCYEIQANALHTTIQRHLYRHRCEQLISVGKERGLW